MATFITSYARQRIINAAQRVTDDYNDGRSDIEFIYADTDSLWLKSKGFKLPDYFDYDNIALGKFKFEGEFSRAKFLRQKCYIADFRKPGEEEFKLKIGMKVKAISGTFAGYSGVLQEISEDQKQLTVLVSTEKRDIPIIVETKDVVIDE